MKKTKKGQSNKKPRTILGQEAGSMLDKKTNEDFNNAHPYRDAAGLKKGNSDGDEKKSTKKLKLKVNEK